MPKRKHDSSASDSEPDKLYKPDKPCVAPFRTVYARNFVPELDIELGNIVALFGRKGAGKSSAMRSLCRALAPRIDLAVVFSPTAYGNNYQDFIPCKYIFSKFDEFALQKIMDFQIESAKRRKHATTYWSSWTTWLTTASHSSPKPWRSWHTTAGGPA